jgi:hypothetical protein
MSQLDGTWRVKRTSGLLPPLVGVSKRIAGTSGSTRIGGVLGVPFDVVGLELRYRWPLSGFVDLLAPDGAGYRGRATLRGHEFARFTLTPTPRDDSAQTPG